MTLPCQVVRTIRPDTVFIPYHWPEERSANLLTIRALDPISKIPEFKVCAVRVEAGGAADPVPEPPVPPGMRPSAAETAPLGEPGSPTMTQGRGTAER